MPQRTCTINGCDRPHQARGYCNSHYKTIIQPNRHKARVVAECAWCGTSVTKKATDGERYRPTCSTTCRRNLQFPPTCELPKEHWARWYGAHSHWPRHPLIECSGCGDMFAPIAEGMQCCSPRCVRRKQIIARGGLPADLMAILPRTCDTCGTEYTSPYVGQTCCKDCKRAKRPSHWITNTRRIALYERDKYKCHLCGKRTNQAGHYLDDDYPTLDHLVPKSKGGSDEDYNLATCCRGCNTARGVDELPMLQLA